MSEAKAGNVMASVTVRRPEKGFRWSNSPGRDPVAEIARLRRVEGVAQEFCDRRDRGEVRIERTYKAFKDTLGGKGE